MRLIEEGVLGAWILSMGGGQVRLLVWKTSSKDYPVGPDEIPK